MTKIFASIQHSYRVTLVLFCSIIIFYFPVLINNFAYHNDYRIFTYDVGDCCMGYPETKHLLAIGRPLLAILLNFHLSFVDSMLSVQLMHWITVAMIAAAASILFLYLDFSINISRLSAALLSFILFTLPSMAINSFWITNLCSEILPIFAVIFAHYLFSIRPENRITKLIVFTTILVSLFVYPPSAMFFASLTFIKFLFGEADTKRINVRNIIMELIIVLIACLAYFLTFKYIIKPFLVHSAFGGFDFLKYFQFIDANYSIYNFSIFSKLEKKSEQLIDLFNLVFSLSFPYSNALIWKMPLLTILFAALVNAGTENVYMKAIRSEWRLALTLAISIFVICLTALPILVSSSEFETPFRAIFASSVIIPSVILYTFDRYLVVRQYDRIWTYKLIVLILVISPAIVASFWRVNLVVYRAASEYKHVLDAVKNDVFTNENTVRVASIPTVLPQEVSTYLSRDFNLIGMNVSLDGIVNAAANELSRDLKGYKIETNLLGPRYDAELSDGIVFSRDGEPRFIKSFSGISGREDFGRWTDGNEVVIEFMRPLPKMFTLKIKAGTSTSLVGVPFDIIIGESRIQGKFMSQEATETSVPFVTSGEANSIAFRFKNIKSSAELGLGSDTRRLGLALISLYIE